MRSFLLPFLFLTLGWNAVKAQTKSPDEFLGYPLGSKFTSHQQVVDYFKYLGRVSKNLKIISYGKSYEGRELLVAVVSSKENIDNLETIKKNNLELASGQKALLKPVKQPVVLWLSYNVHGNEASPTETALKMAYVLAEGRAADAQWALKNTVVIIDPCLNPDGRERYVNYFKSVMGYRPDPNPMSREHIEPWPGGRTNHYYFDLNRDWAWQTQIETQQRLTLYQEWLPEVHLDFHEQNYNEPYYFAPAAEPIHQDITVWQREFQLIAGKSNAKLFDQKGWKYFTKEQFDLLYPSYGDTYPLYNGAIGMTYEQGGIAAGLSIVTLDGDTLTLKDRIDHHFAAGINTLTTVSKSADKLLSEFKLYFEHGFAENTSGFNTYVVKGDNLGKLKRLRDLLRKNHIEFAYGGSKTLTGYNYETGKTESFKLDRNDLIVPGQQSRAVLVNVLFEPQTAVKDSNTYDITAWALPYAYGLKAYAVKEVVKGGFPAPVESVPLDLTAPYAWILPWNSLTDVQMLIALQNAGIKVRMGEESFTIQNKSFLPGSLLIYRAENEKVLKGLSAKIQAIEKQFNQRFYQASSGLVDKGKDLGSAVYSTLITPKIAVVSGTEISSQSLGEIWHFFEQDLNYPLSMIGSQDIGNLDINRINTLILPDGFYPEDINGKLEDWIKLGGKLILFEDAISSVMGKKPFEIQKKEYFVDDLKLGGATTFGSRKKNNLSESISGAIFKVHLDHTHPVSAGLGDFYYTLKTDSRLYEPLSKGWNIGLLKPDSYVAGVVGQGVAAKISRGMLFGIQPLGKGNVAYFGGNILFRSFWENGKQLFANTVFLLK
ncbi:M14 metallopeptidase family protein [Pedobacter sp. MC2016-24]|uniref:M14 metallopeptidase family protein n=1 Tax=Pedobacter sp. MC2016-24 TaxID=2780090 RepID=UPI001882FDAD|nr:M14 metallopeptidase family protein [Pedobacter sp. MC2016-24]MBE9602951.1 zinc carboxypeptidase [Pedobacter sp. MC2016-24]